MVGNGVDLVGDGSENSMNFDIAYDANKLEVVSVMVGAAAQNADKTLEYSEPASGVVRIILFGLNQNVIADGRVAELQFRIKCSKGTYIRSIAHDFGKALNSGGHLSSLRRTKIGDYNVNNAVTPANFKEMMKV